MIYKQDVIVVIGIKLKQTQKLKLDVTNFKIQDNLKFEIFFFLKKPLTCNIGTWMLCYF